MAGTEQPEVPIWAAAKARQQIDLVREVSRVLAEAERERANRPIGKLTESDLEAEQLRLEEILYAGTMTVEDFNRLREVDVYLEGMRQRRGQRPSHQWRREFLGE